jgi:aromatic ring-cleaving dioxygenase
LCPVTRSKAGPGATCLSSSNHLPLELYSKSITQKRAALARPDRSDFDLPVAGGILTQHGRVAAAFPDATLGRWHDAPVGPHPQSMYQIAFPTTMLAPFLPWLMLNRDGLSILLHPGTGDAYADHTDHAVWFGGMLPPRLDVLRKT